MSKVGNQPVTIPEGVNHSLSEVGSLEISGPLGSLQLSIPKQIVITVSDNNLLVERKNDKKRGRALHGLFRMLIANMVHGVTKGWEKQLELVGTGYRAAMEGASLRLNVGYSHSIVINPPEGVSFTLDGQQKITVQGIDKQLVGETSAKIRAVRPPEPYKGKGIRYLNEAIRRKAGKAAKGAG